MSYLLHPSGSLSYHLRAWRWRRTWWAPFHAEVRRWLSDWRPLSRRLVLIGPSGGYALSRQFLARFQHIDVLEPDPLARWLLRRRFPERGFAWRESDFLPRPDGFEQLAATYPDAAFLFCNLLGQELQGETAAFDRASWLAALQPALAGREWASWHDLVSTARAPDQPPPSWLDHALPLDDLVSRCWQGGSVEIIDHATAGLCPEEPRRYCLWYLAPRRYHLIEWLSRASQSPHP
jgi:hypothetical protein